jgi:hypothetical protein
MITRFQRRAATAAVLLALLLAACGTGPGTDLGGGGKTATKVSPLEAITLASSRTSEAKTAKLAMTTKAVREGTTQTTTGKGVVDLVDSRLQMTMSMGGERVEMRFDGKAYYMRSPSQPLPGGKAWLKMDLETLSKRSGVDVGALTDNTNYDPTQALAYLKAAANDVREVGTEQVRGAETTRYKATIDVRKAVEHEPADKGEAMEKLYEAIGTTSFPADVWIDAEGRMRKMRYVIDFKLGGTTTKVNTTLELYDFGTPLKVKVPPASDTADLAELIGMKMRV